MKIAVFGSTGPLGIELVKQALEAGYEVTAFARNTQKLDSVKHKNLSIVEGTLDNKNEIKRAVTSVDAVISLIGPKGKVPNTELSDGASNIIESMKKVGTKRLIELATASVRDPQDSFDLKYKLLVSMIKLTVKSAYDEIVRIGELVRSSNLDWTLVRVGWLNDGEVQPLKVGYYGQGIIKVKISRASIAKFMLDQLTSKEYIRKAPAISN